MLENSDSVLILGKDTGPGLERLKRIEIKLQELGYYTYIIKEQPDKPGERYPEGDAVCAFLKIRADREY